MAAPLAQWRTASSVRRTGSTDTLSVDVEAFGVGNDPMQRVEFSVLAPGNPVATIIAVSEPTMRQPNYSTAPMKQMWAYGIELDCATLPAGITSVSAVAYSASGANTPLPSPVVLQNDKDGTNTRGSSTTIYVNASTGNDANNGDISNPVRTLIAGLLLARRNPLGNQSSLSDMNSGGALVVCTGDFVGFSRSNFDQTPWHTGDFEYVTLLATPGTTLRRNTIGIFTEPYDYIFCRGVNSLGKCRVKFVGWKILGPGPTALAPAGVFADIWADNCEQTSNYYRPEVEFSVRHLKDPGAAFAIVGPGITSYSNFRMYGRLAGLESPERAHDFTLSGYLGIAMTSSGSGVGGGFCNGLIERQRYKNPVVAGCLDVVGGSLLTLTVPSAGTVRIEQTGTLNQSGNVAWPVSIATQCAEIVNDSFFGLRLSGFGLSAPNNRFLVTGAGVGGNGNPFVTITCNTLGAQTAPVGAALETTLMDGRSYSERVHPDIHQWNSDWSDSIHSSIAVRDIENSQGYFAGGHQLTRCVVWNCTDGGNELRHNLADGAALQSCLFEHCSFTGPLDFEAGASSSNNTFLDLVVRNQSSMPTGNGNVTDRCHYLQGTPIGTNSTTGTWFATAVASSPWSFMPTVGNLSTGSSGPAPRPWRWPGSVATSRGCFGNVGTYNWGNTEGVLAALSAAGGSGASLAATARVGAVLLGAGSSGASLVANVRYLILWVDQGTSQAGLNAFVTHPVPAAFSAAGLSAASLTATKILLPILTAAGGSSAVFVPYSPGVLSAALMIQGSSLSGFAATVFSPITAKQAVIDKRLMKQRIYNALTAFIKTGKFYACVTNVKTGEITIDFNKQISPTAVVVKEQRAAWRPASLYRRSSNASEMESWSWVARVSFSAEVACEAFEIAATDAGIKIPPQQGLDTSRTLVVRLADSEYVHPPEQSPSNGTTVEFSFEVVTDLLRK